MYTHRSHVLVHFIVDIHHESRLGVRCGPNGRVGRVVRGGPPVASLAIVALLLLARSNRRRKYMYAHIILSRSLSLSLYIYISVYINLSIYPYIHIYIGLTLADDPPSRASPSSPSSCTV